MNTVLCSPKDSYLQSSKYSTYCYHTEYRFSFHFYTCILQYLASLIQRIMNLFFLSMFLPHVISGTFHKLRLYIVHYSFIKSTSLVLNYPRAYIQTTNDLIWIVIGFEATYVNVFAYSADCMRKWENADYSGKTVNQALWTHEFKRGVIAGLINDNSRKNWF